MSHRYSFETRVTLAALLSGLPGVLVSVVLLWVGDYSDKVRWTFLLLIVLFWLGFVHSLRERVIRPLQTLSNLLAALREGDYSIRARGAESDDALGYAMREVNTLGETLREQRLGAVEATGLVRTVMAEIDVAVFAFDTDRRLRIVNRAGERLIGQPVERILGKTAAQLGLDSCLTGEPTMTLRIAFPGGGGPWGVRRGTFREKGYPHHLLVLSDLSGALREEERKAWQRLIRVIGHELNNSLAPIKSIASSLERILATEPRSDDWEDDMLKGLAVIESRSEALSRFMTAYSRLAKLPSPTLGPVKLSDVIGRVARLETRMEVQIVAGDDITVLADSDQLEQALINLLQNAVDASLQTEGSVTMGWNRQAQAVSIWIKDEGMGLANTGNLFVPFFTTKPHGSGIGLVLSRQIAEAHRGTLTLENRKDRTGCIAVLNLPLRDDGLREAVPVDFGYGSELSVRRRR